MSDGSFFKNQTGGVAPKGMPQNATVYSDGKSGWRNTPPEGPGTYCAWCGAHRSPQELLDKLDTDAIRRDADRNLHHIKDDLTRSQIHALTWAVDALRARTIALEGSADK